MNHVTHTVEISIQVIGGIDDGRTGRVEIDIRNGKRPSHVRIPSRGITYRLRECLTGNYLIHPDYEALATLLLGPEGR